MFLSRKFFIKYLFISLFIFSSLTASCPITASFKGPTEQLIQRESWNKIHSKLHHQDIPSQYYPLFDSIAETENWGHIGYHGANQDYRIFQDIIRFVVEEIFEIPIKDDFHFLRVPGDSNLNFNSVDEFNQYWGKLDNKGDIKGKQLLSLNLGIYSNYDEPGSCSLNLFIHDKSKHDIDYIDQLSPFFDQLGIDSDTLTFLFKIAHKYLVSEGGTLLKISENSHISNPDKLAYVIADELLYPAIKGGHPYDHHLFSYHLQNVMTQEYVAGKVNIAPQYRLLINNQQVLNPFSVFEIQRWDLYDAQTIVNYESEMRDFIKNLKYNKTKVKNYRQLLLYMWQ